MLAGAVPFALYVRFIAGDRRAFVDHQVRTVIFTAAVTAGLGGWLAASGQLGLQAAFRHASFNEYATMDY